MTIISDNWRFTGSQKAKDLDCGVTTESEIYRRVLAPTRVQPGRGGRHPEVLEVTG
ncbi:hypothetical protein DPX16_15300 [Anabarilius grahami]|uniref:Uncharacterized protein n=1 Tax=Anabarilius grahami TaxID=495550 RepID=A0A3N0XVL9_ANAGA|nr:hypothetical protein DPX16_15300 [Anabarilius grahami]